MTSPRLLEIPAEATDEFSSFMDQAAGEALTTYAPDGFSAWGTSLIRAGFLKADTELLLNGNVRRVTVKSEAAFEAPSSTIWRITLTLVA